MKDTASERERKSGLKRGGKVKNEKKNPYYGNLLPQKRGLRPARIHVKDKCERRRGSDTVSRVCPRR